MMNPAGMLRRVIERARPGATIDAAWSSGALVSQAAVWGANLVRGAVVLRRVPSGPRFCEPGVMIRGRANCRIGAWSILERNVTLRCHGGSGVDLGERVVIGSHSVLEVTSGLGHATGEIRIGSRSSLGDFCYVGGAGGVIIGNEVLCGQYVSFHSENHRYHDAGASIKSQGVSHRGIRVADGCWIGAGATILDGVHIGEGAVVAAGAVVTKSVRAHAVVAGVPAQTIGERGVSHYETGP